MKGTLDMYYFMDIFYALGLNVIKKVCVKYGQMDEPEKKYLKHDEVVELMKKAVKEPEIQGTMNDYTELCKLYDKNENGTIMLAELENFLSNLGNFCIYSVSGQYWHPLCIFRKIAFISKVIAWQTLD